jgi:hypothetical protein
MILSYKHRFIFIKGRKVAGTSIEMALSPYCGPRDIITPISPVDERMRLETGGQARNYSGKDGIEAHYLELVRARNIDAAVKTRVHSDKVYPFFNHMSLATIETLLKPAPREYSLIYVVRNPYEKVASLANMYLSFAGYSGNPMENTLADIRKSIGELFDSGQYLLARNYALYQPGTPYKAHIILRHEHLETGFRKMLSDLEIDTNPAQLPHAKQGSINKGYRVKDMFTRAQLDSINTGFAQEFDAYGYLRE